MCYALAMDLILVASRCTWKKISKEIYDLGFQYVFLYHCEKEKYKKVMFFGRKHENATCISSCCCAFIFQISLAWLTYVEYTANLQAAEEKNGFSQVLFTFYRQLCWQKNQIRFARLNTEWPNSKRSHISKW